MPIFRPGRSIRSRASSARGLCLGSNCFREDAVPVRFLSSTAVFTPKPSLLMSHSTSVDRKAPSFRRAVGTLVGLVAGRRPAAGPGELPGKPSGKTAGNSTGAPAANAGAPNAQAPGTRPSWCQHLPRAAAGPTPRKTLPGYCNIGDTTRFVTSVDEVDEHPPANVCAQGFLSWMTECFPESAGKWITARDIELRLYPAFVTAGGGRRSFLSVARGLGRVTRKRQREYLDLDGRRRTCTEYLIPSAMQQDEFYACELVA